MKKVRIISAEEAALLVNDGDTISTGGFVSSACPEALSKAVEKRFLERIGKTTPNSPSNLSATFFAISSQVA